MITLHNKLEEKAQRAHLRLEEFARRDLKIFATSSFQTHSIPLLHIISCSPVHIPVIFINTGYLFPETLKFKDQIKRLLGLTVFEAKSSVPKSEQRTADARLLFAADPDKCCYLNKTAPLEPYLREYDVWVNGIRAEQNTNRSELLNEHPAPHGVIRFHPLLDWTEDEVRTYRDAYKLPKHPLETEGYLSIGCMPCTIRTGTGTVARGGRWPGQKKTECGLHTDLTRGTERQE